MVNIYLKMNSTVDKMAQLRDPLFVISTSIEIIKQRSGDAPVETEIKRIRSALAKIEQIIQ